MCCCRPVKGAQGLARCGLALAVPCFFYSQGPRLLFPRLLLLESCLARQNTRQPCAPARGLTDDGRGADVGVAARAVILPMVVA